jgi:hypothetical protein
MINSSTTSTSTTTVPTNLNLTAAFLQANAAFSAANVGNTFVNTGGTVGGAVTVSGQLNVTGNVIANISPPNITGYQLVADSYPSNPASLILDFANSKALDPRITFARASTATYYDGITSAVAEQNLMLQSQTFNNAAWAASGSSLSSTIQTAPDATSTATTLLASATTSAHSIGDTFTSYAPGTYTFSAYLQQGTSTFASLYLSSGGASNAICTVNLSTGAVTKTANNSNITYVSSAITSSTGTWYRVSLTVTLTATVSLVPGIQINSSSTPTYATNNAPEQWTAAGTETINIWGAQLEQRSAVTAYTPTTTQSITNYIPVLQTAAVNAPRFDNNPITIESLGLLIEESRINLTTYSADFSNAAWTKTRTSAVSNIIVGPDGTQSGTKEVEDTSAGTHTISRAGSISLAASTAYTCSLYLKAGERTIAQVRASLGGSNYSVEMNLTTGAISSIAGEIPTTFSATSVGNGWYRVVLTGTSAGTTVGDIVIRLCSAAGTNSYTGDGYSGLFIWGAQLEAGTFATSYIPTVTTQVTRAADSASMTGTNFSSWYNQSQGSFYGEATSKNSGTGINGAAAFNMPGSGSDRVTAFFSASTHAYFESVYNGSTQYAFSTTNTVNSNAPSKMAVSYATNSFNLSSNGTTAATATNGLVMPASSISFGSAFGTGQLNGTIKRIMYYPLALTATQLQALTT